MSPFNLFNQCGTDTQANGKVALVTGGTSGLGLETAKNLARRGAKVIITGRKKDTLDKAIDEITKYSGNQNVIGKEVDYLNLTTVRAFASDTIATQPKLDILINNVGAIGLEDKLTADSLNAMMQVNYFGAFLLTYLLFPLLKSSAPSRVINVSSLALILGHVNPDRLNDLNTYSNFGLYSNAKLANVLSAYEMNKRIKGSGVNVYSMDPGLIKTNFFRFVDNEALKTFLNTVLNIFGQPVDVAAKAPVFLVLDPAVNNDSGKHFRQCFEFNAAWFTKDEELNKKLWQSSKRLVKITDDEDWEKK
ncbi:retinol dehydrogenase 11-like [Aphomia sociella]